MKIECLKMAEMMENYATSLARTNQKMIKLHATPHSDFEQNVNAKVLPASGTPHTKLSPLNGNSRVIKKTEKSCNGERLCSCCSVELKQMFASNKFA